MDTKAAAERLEELAPAAEGACCGNVCVEAEEETEAPAGATKADAGDKNASARDNAIATRTQLAE